VWVNRVVSVESRSDLQILRYKHFMTVLFILISHSHWGTEATTSSFLNLDQYQPNNVRTFVKNCCTSKTFQKYRFQNEESPAVIMIPTILYSLDGLAVNFETLLLFKKAKRASACKRLAFLPTRQVCETVFLLDGSLSKWKLLSLIAGVSYTNFWHAPSRTYCILECLIVAFRF
jgi:hypothetical protein